MTPNWQESLALLGQSEGPATEDAVAACGRELVSRFGCHVVMTLGSRGISFFHRDALGDFRVPALAKEVFDVSGAGDTVVAAFALALASGCSHMDAIDLANRAAGVVVAKHGTATVSPQELLSEAETESRALGRDELRDVSARLRAQGKRIVTLNGSFDVMHTGHLHILKEAKRQGDVLIVGVNSDASVRSYKGPGRPINSEQQRAEMLLANRYVDYVHVFDETVPMAFIEAARPDVHVNGAEYGDECVEAPTVRRLGARLHLVPRLPGLSTTELLQRTKPDRSLSALQNYRRPRGRSPPSSWAEAPFVFNLQLLYAFASAPVVCGCECRRAGAARKRWNGRWQSCLRRKLRNRL